MKKDLKPLKIQAIGGLATIVAEQYSHAEIVELFVRHGFKEIEQINATKEQRVKTALQKLQNQAGGKPNGILNIVQDMCSPQGWIGRPEEYEDVLNSVNSIMGFYGLKIADDGSLINIPEETSTVLTAKNPDEVAFDSRAFHEQIRIHGRSHFARGVYFHAVFECCKAFDTAIKNNSGIEQSGRKLMEKALSPGGPIKLNSLLKQSEKDEQEGYRFLCMGLMSAVRNPQAHEPELNWPMTKEDSLDVLALLSFLFRKLGKAGVLDPITGQWKPIEL